MVSLLLPLFACSGSENDRSAGSTLPYREVVLSHDQASLATRLSVADRPAVVLRGAGDAGGTVLVVVSASYCQKVKGVEREARTVVVVLVSPPLRKNEFCRLDVRGIALEVDVTSAIDEVSAVVR